MKKYIIIITLIIPFNLFANTSLQDEKINIGLGAGMSILANPVDIDVSSRKSLGALFDVTFLYALNEEMNFKIGIDITFSSLISKYDYNSTYSVRSLGVFLLSYMRYDFIKRKYGNNFIPYMALYLGMLFPYQKGAVDKDTLTVAYGAGFGFDFWFSKVVAFSFRVKLLFARFSVLPDLNYSNVKYCMWVLPVIGVNIAL